MQRENLLDFSNEELDQIKQRMICRNANMNQNVVELQYQKEVFLQKKQILVSYADKMTKFLQDLQNHSDKKKKSGMSFLMTKLATPFSDVFMNTGQKKNMMNVMFGNPNEIQAKPRAKIFDQCKEFRMDWNQAFQQIKDELNKTDINLVKNKNVVTISNQEKEINFKLEKNQIFQEFKPSHLIKQINITKENDKNQQYQLNNNDDEQEQNQTINKIDDIKQNDGLNQNNNLNHNEDLTNQDNIQDDQNIKEVDQVDNIQKQVNSNNEKNFEQNNDQLQTQMNLNNIQNIENQSQIIDDNQVLTNQDDIITNDFQKSDEYYLNDDRLTKDQQNQDYDLNNNNQDYHDIIFKSNDTDYEKFIEIQVKELQDRLNKKKEIDNQEN